MISKLPNSLSFRLLAITTAWTVVALFLTGFLLSAFFKQNAEKNFEELLLAHTYNLIGAVDIDPAGKVIGNPNLGDPRFLAPNSGWYWAVSRADLPQKPLLHSASIAGDDLKVMSRSQKPFNDVFRRLYRVDEDGIDVQRLEALLFVGESDTLYQVMVGGNRAELEAAVSQFRNTLSLFFGLFGLGAILTTFAAIRFGLRPLAAAQRALAGVRAGEADHLEGNYPTEIEPLAKEINALISANRSVVERARTQVGNLAHALKTPLAVILNEARKPDGNSGDRITEQATQMRSQVQNYLDRARIAAQRGGIAHRTPVRPVVERLLRVMKKLSPRIEYVLDSTLEKAPVFRGEAQDLEEILGNLLENASRFAENKVQVTVSKTDKDDEFSLTVADDGPGLSPQQRELALQRGKRLDESKPGSGLGLSIVSDIVNEYGGRLNLTESEMGGLSVAVFLPKVAVK